jgi:hypothetical protein
MLKVQPELWLTVNVRPATVSVPVRAGPVVATTANWTVPLPFRLPAFVIVIHDALLAAVHSHPATVVTATVPEPPAFGTDDESGLMLKRQPLFCLRVKTCSPIRRTPVRAGPSDAPTRNVMVAGPLPDGGEVIDIHAASLCADHGQPALVVRLIAPVPPSALTVWEVGAMVMLQPPP